MTMKGNRDGTLMPESLSTKLNRIAETARRNPEYRFRTLAHLVSEEMLLWAYRHLRKDAAAGVDGVSAEDYERNLVENIRYLHSRLRERRYRAQALRRVYIEKDNGKKRPLSIPALEDKIVQKAVAEILSRIYERDFLPCSYGYRIGRSAQGAFLALREKITLGKVDYV